MTSSKVQSTHCGRMAFVYVRQSTWLQVKENRESTERQYNLRERAIELGWPASRVEVIDEDQGRSGSTADYRTGFQRLAAEVGSGNVGIVLMLEASRLARNNSDWYRLIEICGISGTLIADESAVYNPREPNDRLLLGVKGTLSEAELFTLRTRLYEGRWNKARKGLLPFPLPVGYVRGADGGWALDPDTQVRERLGYVFNSFRRYRVVRAVVRDLRSQGLELPTRVCRAKEGYGSLVWKAPTLGAVFRILHNPAYAGAYVYGQWEYPSERRSPKTGNSPCPFHGTMADEDHGASCGLHQLGGICEEPGPVAAERERRVELRGGAGRKCPAARDGLLRHLRPQDERAKPGGERGAIARLSLWTGLSRGRRKDLSKYGFSARGCRCGEGVSDRRFADEPRCRDAGIGSGRGRFERATPAARITTGASAL